MYIGATTLLIGCDVCAASFTVAAATTTLGDVVYTSGEGGMFGKGGWGSGRMCAFSSCRI